MTRLELIIFLAVGLPLAFLTILAVLIVEEQRRRALEQLRKDAEMLEQRIATWLSEMRRHDAKGA